jgi:hypothetical protein
MCFVVEGGGGGKLLHLMEFSLNFISVFYSAAAENNVYNNNKQVPNVVMKEIFP